MLYYIKAIICIYIYVCIILYYIVLYCIILQYIYILQIYHKHTIFPCQCVNTLFLDLRLVG